MITFTGPPVFLVRRVIRQVGWLERESFGTGRSIK
jgi:hypothetical protein